MSSIKKEKVAGLGPAELVYEKNGWKVYQQVLSGGHIEVRAVKRPSDKKKG